MGLARVIANPDYAGWEGGRGKLLDTTLPNLAANVTLLQHMARRRPIPRERSRTRQHHVLTPFNPTA